MTFSTSYYANIKNIPKDNILVSISAEKPDYIDEIDIWDTRLAPSFDILMNYKSSKEDKEIYAKRFGDEILIPNDITKIFKEWTDKFGVASKFTLLCYESNDMSKDTFCHRRIVAEAIEEKYGIKVLELNFDYERYKIEKYQVQFKEEIDDDEW